MNDPSGELFDLLSDDTGALVLGAGAIAVTALSGSATIGVLAAGGVASMLALSYQDYVDTMLESNLESSDFTTFAFSEEGIELTMMAALTAAVVGGGMYLKNAFKDSDDPSRGKSAGLLLGVGVIGSLFLMGEEKIKNFGEQLGNLANNAGLTDKTNYLVLDANKRIRDGLGNSPYADLVFFGKEETATGERIVANTHGTNASAWSDLTFMKQNNGGLSEDYPFVSTTYYIDSDNTLEDSPTDDPRVGGVMISQDQFDSIGVQAIKELNGMPQELTTYFNANSLTQLNDLMKANGYGENFSSILYHDISTGRLSLQVMDPQLHVLPPSNMGNAEYWEAAREILQDPANAELASEVDVVAQMFGAASWKELLDYQYIKPYLSSAGYMEAAFNAEGQVVMKQSRMMNWDSNDILENLPDNVGVLGDLTDPEGLHARPLQLVFSHEEMEQAIQTLEPGWKEKAAEILGVDQEDLFVAIQDHQPVFMLSSSEALSAVSLTAGQLMELKNAELFTDAGMIDMDTLITAQLDEMPGFEWVFNEEGELALESQKTGILSWVGLGRRGSFNDPELQEALAADDLGIVPTEDPHAFTLVPNNTLMTENSTVLALEADGFNVLAFTSKEMNDKGWILVEKPDGTVIMTDLTPSESAEPEYMSMTDETRNLFDEIGFDGDFDQIIPLADLIEYGEEAVTALVGNGPMTP